MKRNETMKRTPTLEKETALPPIEVDMPDSARKKIILACYDDPVLFLDTFLDDWFPGPVPWFHRGMIAITLSKVRFLSRYGDLDKVVENFTFKEEPGDPDSRELPLFGVKDGKVYMRSTPFIMIMLPRGFSKTTIINACLLYSILYELIGFPLLLSESATHSSTQLNNVKRQLEQNEKLRLVYGDLVPTRQSPLKWTDQQAQTTNNVAIFAKGRGGQVRGSNVGGKRPDLIVIDDVEDQESVQSEEQREKTRKWFYEAVMPALPLGNAKAKIVVACTLLHREALATYLQRDPQWTTVIFSALDRDGKPLWPEVLDEEALERKKNSFALVGNLAGFYREYHNTLRHEDSQKFKPEYIRIQHYARKDFLGISLVLDPAISESKSADFTSLAVTGIMEDGEISVLESHSERGMEPRAQVDAFFDFYFLWKPQFTGIEAISFQRALIFLAREEMARRGTFFHIEPIKHGKTGKIERVEGALQPRYAAGFISHRRHFPLLEQQLFDWPNGKRDAPDAVAMAVTLLAPLTGTSFDPEAYVPELYTQAGSEVINIEGAP